MSLQLPARSRGMLPAQVAPAAKAGPLGPGAGPLMTEFNLSNVLGPLLGQKGVERMTRAMKVALEVDWIRAAERAIRDALVRCEWHLEDPDEKHIDAEYSNPVAVKAWELLSEPQAQLELKEVGRRQSRRQQLTLTSRHMGAAGNAAWMADAVDQLGLPHAILYIRPDRLTPACTDNGVLTGWALDKRPGFEGTPITLDELYLLQLDPPDQGVWGPGLIESVAAKAVNSGLIDKHFQTVLTGGGRISGVLSPKEGIIPDDVFQQLVRDWRNITEQPDAARRLQIVKAPVEFTSTVQTAAEMALIELMDHYRDSGLGLWGVPLTMLNGQNAGSVGMNNGDGTRKADEAVMWQAAVLSRLEEIREAYQTFILDRWEPVLGWAPKLCYDPPDYDDETPAFDRAQKARELPLRNKERRELVGLEPFGDPSLDNQVLMPIGLSIAFMAPDEDTGKIPTEVSPEAPEEDRPQEPPPMVPGQMPPAPGQPGRPAPGQPPVPPQENAAKVAVPAKGSITGDTTLRAKARTVGGARVLETGAKRLRQQLDDRIVPKVEAAVAAALDHQGDAIAAAVERNWEGIVQSKGRDASQWWREGSAVERALLPGIGTMAEQVEAHLREAFGEA